MPIKVKICGIRTKSAALAATKAGADFLGFNFVPTSKRKVAPSKARTIINNLPKKRPQLVGVFQNQSLREIKAILKEASLDLIQLHGEESPAFAKSVGKPVIKAFGVDGKTSAGKLIQQIRQYKIKYVILDRKNRGEGKVLAPSLVRQVSKQFPVLLAGGLTPSNVEAVIKGCKGIKGVDVAGGVENLNIQSAGKIKEFIIKSKQ